MRKFFLVALAAVLALGLSAEEQGIPGLQHYTLANGLQLYAYHDAEASMARMEIVFRAGAGAQTEESFGLFRLYSDLLVGDPALYQAKLAALGASSLNSRVDADKSDYWISLPVAKVSDGLSLCASLLDPARMSAVDEASFSAAKSRIIEQLKEGMADPSAIYEASMNRRLFSKYPWRVDASGSEKALAAAKLDAVKALAPFFSAGNAAIFVGGNIDPDKIKAAAEVAFSAWPGSADPWPKKMPQNPKPGVARPTWIAYADSSLEAGKAQVEARYRGPDLAYDPASCLSAELWCALVSPEGGRFKTAVAAALPSLEKESLSASYTARKDASLLSISASFSMDEKTKPADLAHNFKERARGYEITSMKVDSGYFQDADYEAAQAKLNADRAASLSTSDAAIHSLAYWWSENALDYFIDFPQAVSKLGRKDIEAFADTYFMRNLEVVAIRLNPADFDREKKSLENSGFAIVTAENAFWWQVRD